MSPIKFAAVLAVAFPAIALAQVGPNPAVKNGSQDPTVGPSTDRATAPNDVPPADTTTMPSSATTPATTSDPATTTADDAKRTTAPTSETKHKKPR